MKQLTIAENSIFTALSSKKGEALTHAELVAAMPVHGYRQGYNDPNLIATHIKSLRKKLPKDAIETVRGVGYKLL